MMGVTPETVFWGKNNLSKYINKSVHLEDQNRDFCKTDSNVTAICSHQNCACMAVFPGSQSLGKNILKNCSSIAVNVISLINNVWRDLLQGCTLTIFQPATLNVKAYIEFFRELINYKGKECYLIPLCQSDPPKVRVSILTFDPMCLLSREHEVLKICVF